MTKVMSVFVNVDRLMGKHFELRSQKSEFRIRWMYLSRFTTAACAVAFTLLPGDVGLFRSRCRRIPSAPYREPAQDVIRQSTVLCTLSDRRW